MGAAVLQKIGVFFFFFTKTGGGLVLAYGL